MSKEYMYLIAGVAIGYFLLPRVLSAASGLMPSNG